KTEPDEEELFDKDRIYGGMQPSGSIPAQSFIEQVRPLADDYRVFLDPQGLKYTGPQETDSDRCKTIGDLGCFLAMNHFAFIILFARTLAEDPVEDLSAEIRASGYPTSIGGHYEKPIGLCTTYHDVVTDCSCVCGSEPRTFTKNGYSVGAVCAPRTCLSFADCPPGPQGDYERPRGVCTYQANGVVTGCSCLSSETDPVVNIHNGYSTGAVCAPRRMFTTCPIRSLIKTYVKVDGRCYTSCTGDRSCNWPSRCENNAVLGEVCFYPQWAD
ncbi:hypothetical protein FOL47_001790, partial [Perkinsus chesapeaki]